LDYVLTGEVEKGDGDDKVGGPVERRGDGDRSSLDVGREQLTHQQPRAYTTPQRRGVVVSGVRRVNEVNARRARLVPGWATVFGRVYHFGM